MEIFYLITSQPENLPLSLSMDLPRGAKARHPDRVLATQPINSLNPDRNSYASICSFETRIDRLVHHDRRRERGRAPRQ